MAFFLVGYAWWVLLPVGAKSVDRVLYDVYGREKRERFYRALAALPEATRSQEAVGVLSRAAGDGVDLDARFVPEHLFLTVHYGLISYCSAVISFEGNRLRRVSVGPEPDCPSLPSEGR